MIACTLNTLTPIIIGDLLISGSLKPDQFTIPVLTDDVLQYLSSESENHPIKLNQKIYILKPNVCIAFSGTVQYIKAFLEDIFIYCNINDVMNAEMLTRYLNNYGNTELLKEFSCLMLIIDKQTDHFQVGIVKHGEFAEGKSENYGEVYSSGSGAEDFVRETLEDAKMISQFPSDHVNNALQANIIMISRLLAAERRNLNSVKKHWGAGFEMIYYNGEEFKKIDEITYVINYGKFDENGDIPEIPIPAIILHYKYHGELLVITVVSPQKGTTKPTEDSYLIESNDLKTKQFVVAPFSYTGSDDFEELKQTQSFVSNKVAMSYIIETQEGYYAPASFNFGSELQIRYDFPGQLTVSMFKQINDILTAQAKDVYPRLK